MKTFFLKFPDEPTFIKTVEGLIIPAQQVLGTLPGKTGFNVNVAMTTLPFKLSKYSIKPETPQCVFAGT